MKNLYTSITIFSLLGILFFPLFSKAQSPEKMSYQAVVRHTDNTLLSNTSVGMQISILQGSASGTEVYVETQNPTTNINGLISIEIGDGSVVSGSMDSIEWSAGPYFIKTETDPNGGTSYSITGTSQLLSVPYALYAAAADEVDGSITNEIQTLTFADDTLDLTDGGKVYLGAYTSKWMGTTTMYNDTATTFGFGLNNPLASRFIHLAPSENDYGMYSNHDHTTSGTTYGYFVDLDNTYTGSGTTYGGYFDSYKNGGGGSVYGVMGRGRNYNSGGSGSTYGVYAYGFRSSGTPASTTYALYALQSGSATTEYAGYFSGNVYTTGSYLPSDMSLKMDVKPFTGALETIEKLNTYTYEYDLEKYFFMNLPEGKQVGLIADNVSEVLPHLTKETVQPAQVIPAEDAEEWLGEGNYSLNEDGMAVVGHDVNFTAVNYAGMVPVLIEAIKEQQTQIKALEEQMKALLIELENSNR